MVPTLYQWDNYHLQLYNLLCVSMCYVVIFIYYSITAYIYKITINIIGVHVEGIPATSADIHEWKNNSHLRLKFMGMGSLKHR